MYHNDCCTITPPHVTWVWESRGRCDKPHESRWYSWLRKGFSRCVIKGQMGFSHVRRLPLLLMERSRRTLAAILMSVANQELPPRTTSICGGDDSVYFQHIESGPFCGCDGLFQFASYHWGNQGCGSILGSTCMDKIKRF